MNTDANRVEDPNSPTIAIEQEASGSNSNTSKDSADPFNRNSPEKKKQEVEDEDPLTSTFSLELKDGFSEPMEEDKMTKIEVAEGGRQPSAGANP